MKRFWVLWGERYLYNPSLIQKILSLLLLPLSWIYCLLAYIRYRRSVPKSLGIPIVSIGNLTVGGSGKTPVVIELAKHFEKPAIVLRGYGRQSSGMVVVKDKSTILCDVIRSGDEAMLYAETLPSATVIVSEIRERGIAEAKAMGCEVVLLDDGYGKHSIEKLDLLIAVPTPNPFCLPSGAYREQLWSGKDTIVLMEKVAFQRSVSIKKPTEKMVLVTAIARPERLDPYLPEVIEKIYFEDHHFFTQGELEMIVERTGATSLLVTSKDLVKMSSYKKLNLSVLELSITLDETLITTVKDYVNAAKN
ncbi:MAG: tetraacyldisaccharide 4'-kinase [Sulfuricurvum sp.]|uniref:tetraacyldisaccharide 4'-kinase n=1 Tax=Sulfuricurvum sp. TaxID=2025608 RepID=UPI002735AB31|nr:tetraacyldisaccharide 4'-kinase [Sulfuricurvum sp.]MDP2850383.1 tetraacyldisaccharide 4'-kinase [Sulfuricurvum sp.]MDP3290823.1 tetraacyldisaccharide 4'-kinase [Sulfuricurvum sp.]